MWFKRYLNWGSGLGSGSTLTGAKESSGQAWPPLPPLVLALLVLHGPGPPLPPSCGCYQPLRWEQRAQLGCRTDSGPREHGSPSDLLQNWNWCKGGMGSTRPVLPGMSTPPAWQHLLGPASTPTTAPRRPVTSTRPRTRSVTRLASAEQALNSDSAISSRTTPSRKSVTSPSLEGRR